MLPVMLKLYTSRLGDAGAPLAPRITERDRQPLRLPRRRARERRLLRRQGAQRRRHQPVVPDPGRAAPERARQVPEPGALPRPRARPPGLQARARARRAVRVRELSALASSAMARGSLVQVMDTTLRDGEQTPNVAYSPSEKLQIARLLLEEVKVDRLEVGQAFVSEGEAEAMKRITAWARRAGHAERIEIFGLTDQKRSVDWIVEHGGGAMNLLTKGSRKHCEGQLRKTPELHFKDIAETIRYARRRKLVVNVYLEDWSQGVRDSFDYVFGHMENMAGLGVRRVYLPDTLGTFTPDDTSRYVELMTRTWPDVHFEFHAHGDYGLATANCLAAVKAGARGVHTSVNGMGERAGNTRLAEVVASLHDLTPLPHGRRREPADRDLRARGAALGQARLRQRAGGRPRRVHPDRRHPRRRRRQGRSVREPAPAGPLRPPPPLRAGQDGRQGVARAEPEDARHQAAARAARPGAAPHRRAGRQEAQRHHRGPAAPDRRRVEDAGRAARPNRAL